MLATPCGATALGLKAEKGPCNGVPEKIYSDYIRDELEGDLIYSIYTCG